MASNNKPLVSICCITYNHEEFIGQAIESFLAQETDFAFEILIHDDASTDNTAEIIEEYRMQYPELIFPIYQTENQYSKGVSISATYNWPRARGKYISMCEGDDYWTDPYKLKKQVDLLEDNPDYSGCAHRFKSLKNGIIETSNINNIKNTYTLEDLAQRIPFQTATFIFQKDLLHIPSEYLPYISSHFIFMLLAEEGNIYFMNDYMSVHRVHDGGVYSGLNQMQKLEKSVKSKYHRINYFQDRNKKVAKILQNKIVHDYIHTMILCIRRNEFGNAFLCFMRSFKYSFGIAQFKEVKSRIKLYNKNDVVSESSNLPNR